MTFNDSYQKTLAMLEPGARDTFKTVLIGCLAHSVGVFRQEQCLDAALAITQDHQAVREQEEIGRPFLVKKRG